MGHIMADLQKFANAEEGFRITLETFEATLADLEQKLNLHLGQWEGEAVAAYRVFFDTGMLSARDLAKEMKRLHRAIDIAHYNFKSAKSASTRMWTL